MAIDTDEEHIADAHKMMHNGFVGKQPGDKGVGDKLHILSENEQELFKRVNDILALDRSQTIKANMFMRLIKAQSSCKVIETTRTPGDDDWEEKE